MAVSVKVNRLTGPASTGTLASTDPGFQPKGLLYFSGHQAATTISDSQWSVGVAGSTTTETAAGFNANDNVTTSDAVRYFNTARLHVGLAGGAATVENLAELSSFDATGFTLNWPTLNLASPLYDYLAIGGADITNVKSGNFALNTTTGNQAVTGVGFQPDFVILFMTLQTTSGQGNNNSQYGFGVMAPSGQWTMTQKDQNALATTNTSRAFRNDRCLMIQNTTSTTSHQELSYVSMDADGFTINNDVSGATAYLVGYMAIKGGQWKVGTETQKTSSGTKATTGVGFQPKGLILGSVCDTQTAGANDHARLMLGGSSGASNNVSVWTGNRDNSADSIANTIMSNTKCLVMATEGLSATPTIQAEAELDSFDADGFTMDWTTADATARVFGYVAIGDNATPPAGVAVKVKVAGTFVTKVPKVKVAGTFVSKSPKVKVGGTFI